ncbi:MAG: peptidoglycan-associated lipoprotein OmpA family [Bacteroidota bacterium]|jgi:outer membrane protein OmpA-like peptidoglycan-associated protein
MKMNYKFTKRFLLGLGLMASVSAYSQSTVNPKSLKKEAYGHFQIDEYHEALPLLLKLDSLQPNEAQTLYKIGVCLFKSHDQHESFKYFDRVRAMEYHKDHHMLDFYLGASLHLNNKFDEAIAAYEKFKSEFLSDKKYKTDITVEDIDREIEMCRVGKELVKNPLKVKVTNLGPNINTIDPEYVPVISADESKMIFTSRRPNTTGGTRDELDNLFHEDLYITQKDGDDWSVAKNMGTPVNTNDHDASIGLSVDGQELFIYRSDPKDPDSGDILMSLLDGTSWKAPVHLSTNVNSPFHETHASLSADEQYLYFTSDKPGGFGGKDIYMVKKLYNGEWALPQNLGDKINTKYDEEGPFIHADGKTLYFSSKGHKTMGGYDIFKTVYNDKNQTWSEPENIGYPINTSGDDVFFVWTPDGKKAYFASTRDGGFGHEDIYVLEKEEIEKKSVVVLKGNVLSSKDKKPVGATISVIDNASNKVIAKYKANAATGHYVVVVPAGKNIGISIDAKDHLFYSENVNFAENTYNEISKDILLEPFKSGSTINLKNVFFETNSAELKNTSFAELDKLDKFLTDNPSIYLKIDGHTDSIGREEDNYLLSKLRTESISHYLSSHGIDENRLVTVGNGELEPLTSNSTEEGRAQNRRVFITIIDKAQDPAMFQAALDKKKELENKYKGGKIGLSEKAKATESKSKIKVPALKAYADSCVYFFVNDYKINKESLPILEELAAVMLAYPKISVELHGFYSKKDGESPKKQLYLKRSIFIQNFLASKKIDRKRIINKDLGGESKDAEEVRPDRIHNRRVEFKIIGR